MLCECEGLFYCCCHCYYYCKFLKNFSRIICLAWTFLKITFPHSWVFSAQTPGRVLPAPLRGVCSWRTGQAAQGGHSLPSLDKRSGQLSSLEPLYCRSTLRFKSSQFFWKSPCTFLVLVAESQPSEGLRYLENPQKSRESPRFHLVICGVLPACKALHQASGEDEVK